MPLGKALAALGVASMLGLGPAHAAGQEPARPIRLKSRTFSPAPGVEERLRSSFQATRARRLHVLVQFDRHPTLEERRDLSDAGVGLLDPVPERAYYASITRPALERAGRLRGLRFVGAIEPNDKIAPWIRREGVPEHARRAGGKAELVVEFFSDVPVRDQQAVLRRHGARAVERVVELSGWRVEVAAQRIAALAGEDAVKWIVEVPAPPEDDNDGVRSQGALDVDRALAAPYGLSGAGVILGQWEGNHASLTHGDLAGRIMLGDPPLPRWDVSAMHTEVGAANGAFDDGEPIYIDMDDSGTISVGDVRATAAAGFPAGSVVAAGNADVGTALAPFAPQERFVDNVTADWVYTAGEPIYRDADWSGRVSAGDTRITAAGAFAAGSVVAAGDADVGNLFLFADIPNAHATHVAGTAIGSGVQSAANGGGAAQWKGVAPGASIRSYLAGGLGAYVDAAANGVAISTNSWGTSHCHQEDIAGCYDARSESYDAVVSGRQSTGAPSGLARRIAIFGSSGNAGRPERHAENIAANGRFDAGEAVYRDNDDSGTVTAGDGLASGPAQPAGTALVNFAVDERHTDPAGPGAFDAAEAAYRDADGSRAVSAGDVRITATAGFPAGSVVAVGDGDIGTALRQFRLWGNVRVPNSAKNTVEVANIASDTAVADPSTSRGPTADGRVKPDLAGPGSQAAGDRGVTSTWPRNRYFAISGTSMSTPAVAGAAALLTEWYRSSCAAGGPRPDVVKALLVHGAEDLVAIPNVGAGFVGPDFATGYGRAREHAALDLVPHHRLGNLAALGNVDTQVTIGATTALKVTLAWNDPPWTGGAAPSATTGLLHNDLDLVLIAPDGRQYTAWQVDAANPFQPAAVTVTPAGTPVPAVAFDRRNTVEQVVVPAAMPGTWTFRVVASTLAVPPQDYVIVSEALAPQQGSCAAVPAADVWLQDNVADTGSTPSAGTMWQSPAVWNRLAPDGGTAHESPEYGQLNHMYASIRNASATSTIRATTLEVWIASAAVGLSWPANFTLAGRIVIPNLTPGEVRTVGPIAWNPPDPSPSSHFCLYARAASSQDPITFAEGSNLDTNARNSNNIVWRNINVVDLASSRSVTFLMRNVDDGDADVDLVVRTDPELLRVGDVLLQPSLGAVQAWPLEARKAEGAELLPNRLPAPRAAGEIQEPVAREPGARHREPYERPLIEPIRVREREAKFRGFRLNRGNAYPVTLTFRSPQIEKKEYVVDVVQMRAGREVGGIRYLVRTGRAR